MKIKNKRITILQFSIKQKNKMKSHQKRRKDTKNDLNFRDSKINKLLMKNHMNNLSLLKHLIELNSKINSNLNHNIFLKRKKKRQNQ